VRLSLGELAAKFGCELIGDPDVVISSVSTLADSHAGSISFLANSAYKSQLLLTSASAVIVRSNDAGDCPVAAVIADDPYLTYARIATALHPVKSFSPGVHESAVVSSSANIAESAHIAAHVVVGDDVSIGEDVFVGPGSFVGDRCHVGSATRLVANVTLVQDVTLGRRNVVQPGVVIGADGFGNAQSESGWVKVPQIGGVKIGDDVEIGANTTIDRGAIGDTIIANGVRLDNLIQIAHNVQIGEHTAMAATVGISGSVIIGKRCLFAGRAGVSGHVTICDDTIVGAAAVVTKDIKEPGIYSSFFAAEKDKSWKRKVARFRRIESLNDRVAKLEKAAKKNDG
jgi:UDP-3-O-[3-hydroxymyristoyl] glucosamine N-acyltransferase